MTGGHDEDNLKLAARKKTASSTKHNADATCSRCNEQGHWQPTSKLCEFFVPPKKRKKKGEQQASAAKCDDEDFTAMRNELQRLEGVPLSDSNGTFYSAAFELVMEVMAVIIIKLSSTW